MLDTSLPLIFDRGLNVISDAIAQPGKGVVKLDTRRHGRVQHTLQAVDLCLCALRPLAEWSQRTRVVSAVEQGYAPLLLPPPLQRRLNSRLAQLGKARTRWRVDQIFEGDASGVAAGAICGERGQLLITGHDTACMRCARILAPPLEVPPH